MGQYMLKRTLVKHGDSINALAFSYDGALFASGADDGLVILFKGNGSGWELCQFQVKAPVAALLWRSCFGYTLMAGDMSGDVHTICLSDSRHVSLSLYFQVYIQYPIRRKTHIIMLSTMFLAQSTAFRKVTCYWLSVQAVLCS